MAKNALLVIGNGFDLQCGLKSGYEDFFDWLSKDDTRSKANLWAVHFLNSPREGKRWADVENRLQKAFNERQTRQSNINRNYVGITLIRFWHAIAIDFDKNLKKGGAAYPAIKEAEYVIKYIENRGKESFPFNSYWFLDELMAFERQFAEYLQAEVSGNANYLVNAAKLIEMMIHGESVHVLNFNYTNPFKPDASNPSSVKLSSMVAGVTNVHGTYADNNIIFGVDATAQLPSDTYIFTKTHRKMLQGTPARALPRHVEEVKFYGHSLGQADYSYFQSIFDYYNLYGDQLINDKFGANPVTLQFYFTVYDESKKTEIERGATDKVHRLISAYGDTLDNKDKGKNLLHKLLLEGRIQIKFLDSIEKT